MGLFSFLKQPKETESLFHDNMNYKIFEGEGLFVKTGRNRKIHIESFSEEEAFSTLVASGYEASSINISRVQFEPPTREQIQAMRKHGNKIPKNACKIDISFLMSKIIEQQHDPGSKLIEFATKQKVKFSYFTGEKSLYSCIWNAFDDTERIAFYLLCVKKDKAGKWDFDSWETYKKRAEAFRNDEKFMNSFKRYLNSGFYGFTGDTSSRNTNCYKMAV
jgi:hypothetical protein